MESSTAAAAAAAAESKGSSSTGTTNTGNVSQSVLGGISGGHQMKYVVITGGTVSGLGKGTTISSIGVVLKSMGFSITAIKVDPYLNVDAGTMSPYEHGEVYVLEDGGEVDLDLGNYERFLNVTLTRDHNITSGKIYDNVIRRERRGDYLGKTVQMIPHVTDAIQNWIKSVAYRPVDKKPGPPDICLVEVGGTVGDIESAVYLEALQQFSCKIGEQNFCLCHLSYVPTINGEQKTKPTQHSTKDLRTVGLRPDFVFCRSDVALTEAARSKIVLFCQVPNSHVISVCNVANVYHVPILIYEQSFGELVCKKLNLTPRSAAATASASYGFHIPIVDQPFDNHTTTIFNTNFTMETWTILADKADRAHVPIRIGIVGKYTGHSDSYISVVKALRHAAVECDAKLEIVWIESSDLEGFPGSPSAPADAAASAAYQAAVDEMKSCMGVLCPGGFGHRGIEGLVEAARFCRVSNLPFLGICLGMQVAVIEFCRNVLGISDANSEEFAPSTEHKVVVFMPEISTEEMGGTMRLGNRATIIRRKNCLAYKLYDQQPVLFERHRHRYEINIDYLTALEAKGMIFVGQDERGQRMEIAELKGHPFFLNTQFHPEFTSRPIKPNPCFLGFVLACIGKLEERLAKNGGRLCSGSTYFQSAAVPDPPTVTDPSIAHDPSTVPDPLAANLNRTENQTPSAQAAKTDTSSLLGFLSRMPKSSDS